MPATWGDATATWGDTDVAWAGGTPTAADLSVDPAFTADFAAAIRRSHTMVVAVDVLHAGVVIHQNLPVAAGSVTINARQPRRRTVTLDVVDADGALTPRTLADLLAPAANELRVRRGVRYPDGSEELYDLGVFRIDADQIGFAGGTVQLTGYDRSIKISRNKWLEPYVVEADTRAVDAVAAMAADRLPGVKLRLADSDGVVAVETVYGQNTANDPWEDIREVGAAAALEVFFDAAGVLVAQPYPDLAGGVAAFTFDDGASGVIVDGTRDLDGADIRNGVYVYGQADTGAVVVGQAWDTNPSSPTYAGMPVGASEFGARPYTYENKALSTPAQVDEVAAALLSKLLGVGDGVSISCLPDPRVDVDQVVRVTSDRAYVNTLYIVDTATCGLAPTDTMSITTRAQRVAA